MTPEQRKLAQALIISSKGKSEISPKEFIERFPSAVAAGVLAVTLLEEAAQAQSAEDLQAALIIGAVFGFSAHHIPLLIQLLRAEWHFCHEEIVSTFQKLKEPKSVDALYSAAFVSHAYLAYDESFGLARKCIWALADIGTPEAKSKLEEIASREIPLIAGYAKKRLEHWNDERDRKRA